MNILVNNLQVCDAALGDEGFVGCGNQTILRVVIYEYLNLVAYGVGE